MAEDGRNHWKVVLGGGSRGEPAKVDEEGGPDKKKPEGERVRGK